MSKKPKPTVTTRQLHTTTVVPLTREQVLEIPDSSETLVRHGVPKSIIIQDTYNLVKEEKRYRRQTVSGTVYLEVYREDGTVGTVPVWPLWSDTRRAIYDIVAETPRPETARLEFA